MSIFEVEMETSYFDTQQELEWMNDENAQFHGKAIGHYWGFCGDAIELLSLCSSSIIVYLQTSSMVA